MVLAASTPAFAQVARSSAVDRAEVELQAVQRALLEGADALARNDADALARYYASEWLSVSPAGAVLASGKGFTATRNGDLAYTSVEVNEPITRVYGNTAVSTSRVTVVGRNRGHDISGDYRVTTMLMKKNGRWLIVGLMTAPAAGMPPSG
jgi:ketosteroid isomerase-like protein